MLSLCQSLFQALALRGRERALEPRLCWPSDFRCFLLPGLLQLIPATDGTVFSIRISGPSGGAHLSGSFIHCPLGCRLLPLEPVLVWSAAAASISAPIKILHLPYLCLSPSENFTHLWRPRTNVIFWWASVWSFQAKIFTPFLCPEYFSYHLWYDIWWVSGRQGMPTSSPYPGFYQRWAHSNWLVNTCGTNFRISWCDLKT